MYFTKYLSGASSDGGTQTNPNSSLGNYRSSSVVISGEIDNLFDSVMSIEAQSGITEYRCICIKNTTIDPIFNVKIWLSAENDPNGDQTIQLAIETPQTANLTDGNAQSISDELTSPTVNTANHNGTGSGISNWASPTDETSALEINQGDHNYHLLTEQIFFIWIKRIISPNAEGKSNVNFTISIKGEIE